MTKSSQEVLASGSLVGATLVEELDRSWNINSSIGSLNSVNRSNAVRDTTTHKLWLCYRKDQPTKQHRSHPENRRQPYGPCDTSSDLLSDKTLDQSGYFGFVASTSRSFESMLKKEGDMVGIAKCANRVDN